MLGIIGTPIGGVVPDTTIYILQSDVGAFSLSGQAVMQSR